MAVSAAAAHDRVTGSAFADPWPWALACVYAAAYSVLGAIRYDAHRNFVDLGIFTQTAASAFGCFCNTVEGSHWAFHFSPILYVAGALMLVWHTPFTLVVLQAVGGSLTVPPVYALVRAHADVRAARLSALVVMLYPPLAGVIFNDFHENGLAPAAVAWLLWAFDAGNAGATVVFTLLALSVKDDQALFVAWAGACAALAYRRDRARMRLAVFAALLAAAVFAGYVVLAHPHAGGRFYAWNGEDIRALVPGGLLARAGFLVLALAPLLFVPLRVYAVVVALPPFAEVLLSKMATTYTMGSHYAGAWAGWLLYAFALGIGRLWQRSPRAAYRVLYWCLALCVAEFLTADPLHPGYFLRPRGARDVALDAFLHTMPRDASVATQEEAYTRMAAWDPRATVFPGPRHPHITACMILTDESYPRSVSLLQSAGLVRRLVRQHRYEVVRKDGSITLYEKTAGC